jgi:Tol biopolymer transport system component
MKKVLYIIIAVILLTGIMFSLVPASAAPRIEMGKIAFSSTRDGNSEIYVMNPDGTDVTRLTHNPGYDALPAWSPDGKEIAFVSNRDGNNEIYVMKADGSNQRNLTKNAGSDSNPSWSPHGNKITFDSDRDGNSEIYVMDSNGHHQKRLTTNLSYDPAWSPDGSTIAFLYHGIWVMNADGTNQHSLAGFPPNYFSPAWSPVGNKIAFGWYLHRLADIGVINSDGSNWKSLTNGTFFVADSGHPDWSPDGSKIVFAKALFDNKLLSPLPIDIWVMNADGTNLVNLTNNPANDSDPAWSRFKPGRSDHDDKDRR